MKDFILPLEFIQKISSSFEFVQVDKGAIKFVLNGADIMCQGLTSQGGLIGNVQVGDIVIIKAEGMNVPLGIGKMIMSEQ